MVHTNCHIVKQIAGQICNIKLDSLREESSFRGRRIWACQGPSLVGAEALSVWDEGGDLQEGAGGLGTGGQSQTERV